MRAQQRLEKAMSKAEGVVAGDEMTEKEKAAAVEKVMRKGMSAGAKKRKEVKVVVAKGPNKGVKGRPKGVKGRYAMVDARMRKEVSCWAWSYLWVCAKVSVIGPGEETKRKGEQETKKELDGPYSVCLFRFCSHLNYNGSFFEQYHMATT